MGVVLAPANGRGAILRLLEAGAHEVYFGFHDESWSQYFGGSADINRMSGFGGQANVLSFEETCDEIASTREAEATANEAKPIPADQTQTPDGEAPPSDSSKATGANLYCTFNSATYTSDQVDYIAEYYLPVLADVGLTGIIVSSPQLIDAAHDAGLNVVASTMCAVYNEDIARFYLERGVRRVILPRDLNLDEIAAITDAVPDLEYEAFLMRNGCVFADSNCLGLHRANCPSMCRSLRESPWWEVPLCQDEDFLDRRIQSGRIHKERFHENTCGLCALWRLEQANINAYKVVGRGDGLDDLCRDVALVDRNLAIAQMCTSEGNYLENMERPDDILALCANQGLSCYYPDVRFS